jgi:hypothetical protein
MSIPIYGLLFLAVVIALIGIANVGSVDPRTAPRSACSARG